MRHHAFNHSGLPVANNKPIDMEKKQWKIWPTDECPNCGDEIEVFSYSPESDDTKDRVYVYDGDDCRCASNCGFTSCMHVDEDSGTAHMDQDGNMDKLNPITPIN